jgi:hypothetical protein
MSTSLPRLLLCLGVLTALAALADPTTSAQPPKPGQKPKTDRTTVAPEDLMRMVPDESALCLVAGDLRTQSDGSLKPAWIKALKDSPLTKLLGDAPELLQLAELRKQIQKYLPVPWPQLEQDIVGDAVVYAYRPPLPAEPDREGALLLLHARDQTLLENLLQQVNKAKAANGELKELRTHQHKGRQYMQRVEENGPQFYWTDGPYVAFSGQEAMVKRAIERKLDRTVLPVPVQRQLSAAGASKALASVWINPRAYDRVLQAKAAELGDSVEGKSLTTFLHYWKALDGVALALVIKDQPELVVSVHASADKLPAAARKVVADMAKPSEVWGALPADSIMALAGRADFPALLETLDHLFPDEGDQGLTGFLQEALGLPITRKLLQALAPHAGPDWGFSLAAAGEQQESPQALLALRLRPDAPDLVEALRVQTIASIAEYNQKHPDQTTLVKLQQDGLDLHCLENAKFPKGFKPAFARKAGYLLMASSPEALVRFGKVGAPPATGSHSPVMKLALKQPRRLKGNRFEHLAWALDQFESVELSQRTEDNNVAWIFRLRAVELTVK